jgi:ribosomal protein S11
MTEDKKEKQITEEVKEKPVKDEKSKREAKKELKDDKKIEKEKRKITKEVVKKIEEVKQEEEKEKTKINLKPILDKKPVKRKEEDKTGWGVLHIYSSYNNTHMHVTDITGSETIVKVTGGMVTKSDRLKATPNVAMVAAKQVAQGCREKGIKAVYVRLRAVGGHNGPITPGPGAQATIRTLTREGIKLGRIEDVTPIPHDSCRKKGGRRGRRV